MVIMRLLHSLKSLYGKLFTSKFVSNFLYNDFYHFFCGDFMLINYLLFFLKKTEFILYCARLALSLHVQRSLFWT